MFILKVYPCNIVVFLIALNCLKLLILKGYLHFFLKKILLLERLLNFIGLVRICWIV